ncbi:MAG TPA: hypothetical protein VE093_43350 [Polyangiaceae bacterium]|nr:hypothetical protein [Polyangiaceae bacterium]
MRAEPAPAESAPVVDKFSDSFAIFAARGELSSATTTGFGGS